MANYLQRILGQPNNKQGGIKELISQMAQSEAQNLQPMPEQLDQLGQLGTPDFSAQPVTPIQPALQGQVQPSGRDQLKNAALDLIMKQMQPIEEPRKPISAGEVLGSFKGGIGSGLKGLASFINTPEGLDLLGSIMSSGGGTTAFTGQQLQQQSIQEQARLDKEKAETKKAQVAQQKLAQEIYGDIPGQEVAEEELYLKQEKQKFDQAIKKAESLAKGSETNMEGEEKLRKEFTKNSGDFIKIKDAYNRVLSSAKNPSAAGDLALIFNFMKILDPASTVREGEFATAEQTGSLPQGIVNKWNRMVEGERLGETRQDFINQAKNLYQAQATTQEQLIKEYKRLAGQYGLNPKNIIGTAPLKILEQIQEQNKEFSSVKEAEAANLPIGTKIIINGRKAVVE